MTITPFPSDNATKKEKESPEYQLVLTDAIWTRYGSDKTAWGVGMTDNFELMRLYAQGNQPTDVYKKQYRGLDRNGNTRRGYLNISESVPSLAPKHITTIKKVVSGSDYILEVTSNSKDAINKKVLKKNRLWHNTKNNELRKQMSSELGQEIPLRNDYWQPENMQELAIYEKYGGFKLDMETAFTKVGEDMFKISDWDYIWDAGLNDLLQTGHAVLEVVDKEDGSTAFEHFRIGDYITSYSFNPNEEPPYAARICWMTIESLIPKLKEAYPAITEDEIQDIAQNSLSHNKGYNLENFRTQDPVTSRWAYYDMQVKCMRYFVKSVDVDRYEARESKDGKFIYSKTEETRKKKSYADGRERSTEEYHNCTIYKGIRLLGMKYVVDCGEWTNVIKNPDGSPALPFVHVTTNESSVLQRWRGWLDDHQMAVLKWRNFLQRAQGDATQYDIGILANIDFGLGKMTQSEVIAYAEETGRLMVATRGDMLGKVNPATAMQTRPVTSNGPLMYMQGVIAYIDAQIRGTVGITDTIAALADSSPEKLVGVGQQEIAAGQNAMYTIAKTMVRYKSQALMKGLAKTRVKLEYVPETKNYYSGIIKERFVDAILAFKDLTLNQIGITLRSKPTPERKQMIMALVAESLKAGKNGQIGITTSDALMVEHELEHGLTEMATFYLAVAEDRASRKMAERTSKATQETAQAQIASAQAATQATARLEQVMSELSKSETGMAIAQQLKADMALEDMEATNRRNDIILKGNIDLRNQAAKPQTQNQAA